MNERQRWLVSGVLVLLLIGAVLLVIKAESPPLPSRQEAQDRTASEVGLSEHRSVNALCSEPTKSGYHCRLRDSAGRYGYALGGFDTEVTGDRRFERVRRNWSLSWDFPIDSDGRLTATLDTTPPRELDTLIFGTLLLASNALIEDLGAGRVECPEPEVGHSQACTVLDPAVRQATVEHVEGTTYKLVVDYVLPVGDPLTIPH